MTINYNNVYINDTATICGPVEKNGPLVNFFDKSIDDFYYGENSFEKGEIKILYDSINILLKKINFDKKNVDLFISSDLLNQLLISNFTAEKLKISYLGIYSACASLTEGIIIGSNFIQSDNVNNCICAVSSHNNTAERQFRYPIEYGALKPLTTTFTVTGGCSCFLSNIKSGIKIDSATIGSVVNLGIKDQSDMGSVMAPGFCQTLYEHLKNTKRNVSYYDLILSGDLGIYGKKIAIEYMKTVYGLDISDNYEDSATLIFDKKFMKDYAGGSGPSCIGLVFLGYIFKKMKSSQLKKVLIIATGSLHSVVSLNQKFSIPTISHAISLESVK